MRESHVCSVVSCHYAYGDFYFEPVVNGQIIKDLSSHEFQQGHFDNVGSLPGPSYIWEPYW